MAIISFAKTTPEYLSGIKTETRRDWSDRQFEMWVRFWDNGNLIHDAWDKLPRAGGKFIGKFRLTARPYPQRLLYMSKEDLRAEGGMCKTKSEFWDFIGMKPDDFVTVITFEKL